MKMRRRLLMSSPLSEFELHFYKKFAVRFVDIYFEDGKMAAGVYALQPMEDAWLREQQTSENI